MWSQRSVGSAVNRECFGVMGGRLIGRRRELPGNGRWLVMSGINEDARREDQVRARRLFLAAVDVDNTAVGAVCVDAVAAGRVSELLLDLAALAARQALPGTAEVLRREILALAQEDS